MENQIDRRLDSDRSEPLGVDRVWEQFFAEAGGDQQKCLMVRGLLTLRDKLSRAETA